MLCKSDKPSIIIINHSEDVNAWLVGTTCCLLFSNTTEQDILWENLDQLASQQAGRLHVVGEGQAAGGGGGQGASQQAGRLQVGGEGRGQASRRAGCSCRWAHRWGGQFSNKVGGGNGLMAVARVGKWLKGR